MDQINMKEITLNIAICDDNTAFSSQVENAILQEKLNKIDIDVYDNGTSLIKECINNNINYSIIFLDIRLNNENGIDIANQIRKINKNILIIYMTEFYEYVYDVFETQPFRFIRKPFKNNEIIKLLYDCIEYIKLNKKYITFKIERTNYILYYDEIIYFEGQGRKIIVYTDTNKYIYYGKISNIIKNLDPMIFCQIHVSYIINMDKIRSINNSEIELLNGTILQISRSKKEEVKNKHMNYLMYKSGLN